jgi:hypothetical protein
LRGLFGRLRAHRVFSWTSGYLPVDAPQNEQGEPDLDKADVISSLYRDSRGHALLIDIDHPTHLVESSPGKFHLYVEPPTPLATHALMEILDVLAKYEIVEPGYAGASRRRGYSSLRPPWKPKTDRPILRCVGCGKRPDEIDEYLKGNQSDDQQVEPDDYVWSNEGTLDRVTGHFACTACYIRMGCPSGPLGWTAGMREGFELTTAPSVDALSPEWPDEQKPSVEPF